MMEKEQFFNYMLKLQDPETSHKERAEMIHELQEDFQNTQTALTEHTEQINALTKEKADLIETNSYYFRQIHSQQDFEDTTGEDHTPQTIDELFV